MKTILVAIAIAGSLAGGPCRGAGTASGEQGFKDIYKELVETNTTLSSGSCTLAAELMAGRLKEVGLRLS